ncbi:MAG: hypothetical protein ACRENM_04205 [Candidatus Dormibacteraceae bacterium]
MTEPSVRDIAEDQGRALGIWCSPPSLQNDTRAKRAVDRILPAGAWRCLFFIAIAGGISAAAHLPTTPGLIVGAAVTASASGYCLLNFWRCREAHCIVSGSGWAALGAFEIAEAAVGHSLVHGDEGLAFTLILLGSIAFETVWRMQHGTNAVRTWA